MGKMRPPDAIVEARLNEEAAIMLRGALQLQQQNRVDEALAAYQAILARWPGFADAWYNLGVLQRRSLRMTEALESYQRALDNNISRPEEVCLNRSVIYREYLHDIEAAMHELRNALTLNPGYAPAVLNLANLHEDAGDRASAITLYEKLLAAWPQDFEALARLANAQPLNQDHQALIGRLRTALATAEDDASRASLGFALGRLLDAGGEYAEAFKVYAAANQASRNAAMGQFQPYDSSRQAAFVDHCIALPGNLPCATLSSSTPQPIFIVGMFRSGSTLAEQLLSGLPGVAAGGEMNFLPYVINAELRPYFESQHTLGLAQLDHIAERYRRQLAAVSQDATYVTDKRPDNFMHLGLIKRLFPGAKIVHTTRAPLDNALSIYFLHLNQQMSYALDLLDIGHYFREYRRLMAHWRDRFGADIFDLSYDELVRDPATTFGNLCAFLDLKWDGVLPQVNTKRLPVRTASVWQVREPLYTSSSGRAGHYRRELAPLQDYLADLL